jgi:hypothetical protein
MIRRVRQPIALSEPNSSTPAGDGGQGEQDGHDERGEQNQDFQLRAEIVGQVGGAFQ